MIRGVAVPTGRTMRYRPWPAALRTPTHFAPFPSPLLLIQDSVLGALGELWTLLLEWCGGRPEALGHDYELLEPLTKVVAACLEKCSGVWEGGSL